MQATLGTFAVGSHHVLYGRILMRLNDVPFRWTMTHEIAPRDVAEENATIESDHRWQSRESDSLYRAANECITKWIALKQSRAESHLPSIKNAFSRVKREGEFQLRKNEVLGALA